MPVLFRHPVHAEDILEQRDLGKEEPAVTGNSPRYLHLVRKYGNRCDGRLPFCIQIILDLLFINLLLEGCSILCVLLGLFFAVQGPHHDVPDADTASLHYALPEVKPHGLPFFSPTGSLKLACQTY